MSLSSPRHVRRSLVVLLLTTTALTACRDDYLNNRDTVALTAGSAMRGNAVVHTIDPWPAVARKDHQHTDGRKVQNAIEIYREKPRTRQKTSGRAVTTAK